MNIYEKIKRIAKTNNVSIAKIERECGLSSAAISKWKSSTPTVKNLSLVAKYLGVSIQCLLDPIKKGDVTNESEFTGRINNPDS